MCAASMVVSVTMMARSAGLECAKARLWARSPALKAVSTIALALSVAPWAASAMALVQRAVRGAVSAIELAPSVAPWAVSVMARAKIAVPKVASATALVQRAVQRASLAMVQVQRFGNLAAPARAPIVALMGQVMESNAVRSAPHAAQPVVRWVPHAAQEPPASALTGASVLLGAGRLAEPARLVEPIARHLPPVLPGRRAHHLLRVFRHYSVNHRLHRPRRRAEPARHHSKRSPRPPWWSRRSVISRGFE